jgi:hypothetical protein
VSIYVFMPSAWCAAGARTVAVYALVFERSDHALDHAVLLVIQHLGLLGSDLPHSMLLQAPYPVIL